MWESLEAADTGEPVAFPEEEQPSQSLWRLLGRVL